MSDIRRYETLDSTNEEARRLAAKGDVGPLWIVARVQTQGRGRRGRDWVSETGNLFATHLTHALRERAGELTFAAALATADTVAALAPSRNVQVKWPNDVLLNGRKTAGILLEAFAPDALAIGIGINLAHCPEGTEFPATSIKNETGVAPTPEAAITRLAAFMASWYERWTREGMAGLRDAWLARASHRGKTVHARLEREEITGVFDDLDPNGALVLRMPDGATRRIAAGDVFF